ncbi:MAG TPA: hypothetical protein VHT70_04410 [Candidatus Saccharimonadales bacterium]|jgi:hypothetical protein|nr:hypothetical protein [Candidatus Saccharimonadales bacterium]
MQEYNSQDNNPEGWNNPHFSYTTPKVSTDLVLGWQTEITEPRAIAPTDLSALAPVSATEISPPLKESIYTDEPIPVPGDHFDLAQFAGQELRPGEETVVNMIDRHIFPRVAEKYPDFVFRDGSSEGIALEHRFPSGERVLMKAAPSGLQVRVKGDMHQYYWSDGVFYREDNPPAFENLPKPGEVPIETRVAIVRDKYIDDAPIRELKKELGDGPQKVTAREMAYISGIAANAEPATVTTYQFLDRVRTRSRSPLQPSDEAASRAAPYFSRTIEHFLDQNGHMTDIGAVTVTGDAIDPRHSATSMQINAGKQWDETGKSLAPFMELRVDRLLGSEGVKDERGEIWSPNGKMQEVVRYTVQDDKLQAAREFRRLDSDGEISRELPVHTTNAEMEDVIRIAHFLRRPKFTWES